MHEIFIKTIKQFQSIGINSVNITCKAGRATTTREIVRLIRANSDIAIVPHIVAFKLTYKELDEALQEYSDLGIKNILAIRGDLDTGGTTNRIQPDFLYATDLVKQIKQWSSDFSIGVAGYPEGHYQEPNFILEAQHLYDKVNAGADYIITQLFFENRDFYDFLERCGLSDIHVPIIPGLTYVKNKEHAQKLAQMAQGSKIPTALLAAVCNDDSESGILWMQKQVKELFDSGRVGAIHFYVFNTFEPFRSIIKALE